MELLIGPNLKQASLGQCLLKAMKPNSVIPPLLFGLGVEIDHAIVSKTLLIELAKLGYSISFDEIKRYKQSLRKNESNSIASAVTEFTQFVADNVDQNVCTLDGKGTFHGMEIIVCFINRQSNPKERIRRIAKIMKSEEVGKKVSIKVKWYEQPKVKALSKLELVPIDDLVAKLPANSTELSVEMLLHSASISKKAEGQEPRPNWNGCMENVSSGCSHPEKFSIMMLPLIDMNPGDESCIYSTLLYIKDLANQMNIETPSITFDQPLWVKAVDIVLTKKLALVVRLGGFPCLMSFLGSVGTCMEGSALAHLFENVYGKTL